MSLPSALTEEDGGGAPIVGDVGPNRGDHLQTLLRDLNLRFRGITRPAPALETTGGILPDPMPATQDKPPVVNSDD